MFIHFPNGHLLFFPHTFLSILFSHGFPTYGFSHGFSHGFSRKNPMVQWRICGIFSRWDFASATACLLKALAAPPAARRNLLAAAERAASGCLGEAEPQEV